MAAAVAAEAAALQGRFWDMHALLFHRQKALEDGDLRRYATGLGLDVVLFDRDRAGAVVLERVRRDVDSGIASGEVAVLTTVQPGKLAPAEPLSLPGRGASWSELSFGEVVLEALPLDVGVGDVPGEPRRVVPDP